MTKHELFTAVKPFMLEYLECALLQIKPQELVRKDYRGLRLRHFYGNGRGIKKVRQNVSKYIRLVALVEPEEISSELYLQTIEWVNKKANSFSNSGDAKRVFIRELPRIFRREILRKFHTIQPLPNTGNSMESQHFIDRLKPREGAVLGSIMTTGSIENTASMLYISKASVRRTLRQIAEKGE